MKKTFLFLSLFVLVSLACDLSVTVANSTPPASLPTDTASAASSSIPASPTGVPATLAPSLTPTAQGPSFEGVEVSVDPLSVVVSPAIASGARGIQIPRAEGEIAQWEKTPGHIQLKLEGYLLQGKLHEPQIYVYPALPYAEMAPAAFESMHRLNNLFYDPAVAFSRDGLPPIPFFNAAQVFASNVQMISFQNGQGVRFLTQYDQYPAPANNHDLFYHFQGLSADGVYYIVAILPVNVPLLADTGDAGAALPAGGVPYPYLADPNADMQSYYKSVTELLNVTPAEAFTPTLDQLDRLIQSMRIAP